MHPQLQLLLACIELEEKEQAKRYSLDQRHTLKSLKAEGLALHPIRVTKKGFGYADYPEISFRLSFPAESNLFREGATIECFYSNESPIKGVLRNFDGRSGECWLFAPDHPDWIEENGVGIKLAPDTHTTEVMKTVLQGLEQNKPLYRLFEKMHGSPVGVNGLPGFPAVDFPLRNQRLNDSQQRAVAAILVNGEIAIVHGPPGTGKTTTLVEAILQLTSKGEKVLVSAPSNAAVDHISRELIRQDVNLLRVGNVSKVDEIVFRHTPEGKLANGPQQKEIKQLKKQAEEFRRMALQYKRKFGKEEGRQRGLLFREVSLIRRQIKKLQAYNEEKLFTEAQVIAGTPIGLHDAGLDRRRFQTLVIDEAGQCIEPLAWCIFPLAEKIVLAGDHWQLPPTVLSQEAIRKGYNRSILELAVATVTNVFLLDVQYRMRPAIAGFSSAYFYDSLLQTAPHLNNTGTHITFIDTAGSGFEEKHGTDGTSLQNEGELRVVQQLLMTEGLDPARTAFISPYSGQAAAARDVLPSTMRIRTIDSFQGQEQDVVIVSLVRSNEDGDIGFLKDYRRMNVAMTRAKEQLFVIGDSATIGGDVFYRAFLEYIEKEGSYRTVWEFAL